jgi:hypothetical protein
MGDTPKIIVGSGWWCDGNRPAWTIGASATRSPAFFDLWLRQVRRCLNPLRVVVTDSASPIKPDGRAEAPVLWIELDRNYGHALDLRAGHIKTKYSGFTRSVLTGAMYALCCDADFYVYVEQDCLLVGEDLLVHAVGDEDADILVGGPPVNGVGLNGAVAAPMLQQSLIVVRRSGVDRFITGILGSPWSDGEVSPEEIMARRLAPLGQLRIPFGRSRPIDFTRSHFYAQHLTDDELARAVQLLEAGAGANEKARAQ